MTIGSEALGEDEMRQAEEALRQRVEDAFDEASPDPAEEGAGSWLGPLRDLVVGKPARPARAGTLGAAAMVAVLWRARSRRRPSGT